MEDLVTIKGTSDGVVISLGDGPLEVVLEEMARRLNSRASFFVGGRVALRVGSRPMSAEQLRVVGGLLQDLGVTLWAVDGTHPTTCAAADELGLEGILREQAVAERSGQDVLTGIVVRRTLRSGQSLNHPGHITLIGDVNPGAELAAAGDVVVWGKLRGTVHAGAMGDDEAVVCALQLAPSQIRIGGLIARSPERGRLPSAPEVARVSGGQIIVERWPPVGVRTFAASGWRHVVGTWSLRFSRLFGRPPA